MRIGLSDVAQLAEDMLPVLVPVAIWSGWFIAARRFERRRRREGVWDEHGPKNPTYSPNPDLRALAIDQPTIDGHTAPLRPPSKSPEPGDVA